MVKLELLEKLVKTLKTNKLSIGFDGKNWTKGKTRQNTENKQTFGLTEKITLNLQISDEL